MNKEEVLSIELPNGAEYQRVEVTDGVISIIYSRDSEEVLKVSEQDQTVEENSNIESTKKFTNKRIKRVLPFGSSSTKETIAENSSKPVPLIGGTEVYQKDNGTDYWYCKIKDGRDEFIYIRFDDLTTYDLLFDSSGKERDFKAGYKHDFMMNVWNALKNKPETKGVWLPVYEPSKYNDGGIQYVLGEHIRKDLDCYRWEMFFEVYSPENGSRMASTTTYFLLLLRWLKDGIVSVGELTDVSMFCTYELTGKRRFGGFYDFVGNTAKIVKDPKSKSGYSIVGGNDGFRFFGLSDIVHEKSPDHICPSHVGLLELIR